MEKTTATLNGWQRLWIVFSWVVAVGSLYAAASHQLYDRFYSDWGNELISYLIESSELPGQTVESVRYSYSNMSGKQIVNALHDKYLPKHPAYTYESAKIDAKYQQREEMAHLSILWPVVVGIPVLVYLAGFAIGWVGAGFRCA